jgi:hypothetical protein
MILAKTGKGAVNQPWIQASQFLVAYAKSLGHAGPEVLYQNISIQCQLAGRISLSALNLYDFGALIGKEHAQQRARNVMTKVQHL